MPKLRGPRPALDDGGRALGGDARSPGELSYLQRDADAARGGERRGRRRVLRATIRLTFEYGAFAAEEAEEA
jgi:hypothetical protein